MNLFNVDEAVKALNRAGVTMSRQNFSHAIVPMLLDTGMAQRLGKGKRSTVVISGHAMAVLHLYLQSHKRGARHNIDELSFMFRHWRTERGSDASL